MKSASIAMKGREQKDGRRRLKVSAAYRRRRHGASHWVPEVSLAGRWLQEAGFSPGDPVVVIVEKNEIRIVRSAA